jgi:hypothetical protein
LWCLYTNIMNWSGTVAHSYNPSYLGGRNWRDQFKANPDKKLGRSHLN